MTTAIIGTGGIGSAIARQLASGGETVRLSSTDEESARRLATEIGEAAIVAVDNRGALDGADAVVLALRFGVLKGVIDEIAGALDHNGIEVLRNQHVMLRRRGQRFCLAGIDDFLYRADLPQAMRGIPKNMPTLLLSHNPGIIEDAAALGINLVLSGHTHGGQVRLPLIGCVYGRSDEHMRFKRGRDWLGGTQIYVSRGLGTVVLPVRYGCPSEIPHFVLEPHRESSRSLSDSSSIDGWPARPHACR